MDWSEYFDENQSYDRGLWEASKIHHHHSKNKKNNGRRPPPSSFGGNKSDASSNSNSIDGSKGNNRNSSRRSSTSTATLSDEKKQQDDILYEDDDDDDGQHHYYNTEAGGNTNAIETPSKGGDKQQIHQKMMMMRTVDEKQQDEEQQQEEDEESIRTYEMIETGTTTASTGNNNMVMMMMDNNTTTTTCNSNNNKTLARVNSNTNKSEQQSEDYRSIDWSRYFESDNNTTTTTCTNNNGNNGERDGTYTGTTGGGGTALSAVDDDGDTGVNVEHSPTRSSSCSRSSSRGSSPHPDVRSNSHHINKTRTTTKIKNDIIDDPMNLDEIKLQVGDIDVRVLNSMADIFSVYFEGSSGCSSYNIPATTVTAAVLDNTQQQQQQNGESVLHGNGHGNGQQHRRKSVLSSLLLSFMPWSQTFMENNTYFSRLYTFIIDICLRGIGQVFYQNNSPLCGFIILIGIFIQSMNITIHGIIAIIAGNITAIIMGFDHTLIRSGLFGHNSFLLGIYLAALYNNNNDDDDDDDDDDEDDGTKNNNTGFYTPIVVGAVVFGAFSSIYFALLGTTFVQAAPLTLPFNLTVMMFFLASSGMSRVDIDPVRTPAIPDYTTSEAATATALDDVDKTSITTREFFEGTIRGIGQVFLADNIMSGVLIFLGVAVSSRISALAIFTGSAIGALTAIVIGIPTKDIISGVCGCNSGLAVAAIFMFYVPSIGALILGILAAVMTVVTQLSLAPLLLPFGLPYLTLPSCVVALLFILLQGSTKLAVPVPLSSMSTPEAHMMRAYMLQDGARFLLDVIRSDSKFRGGGGGGGTNDNRRSRTGNNNNNNNNKNKYVGKIVEAINLVEKQRHPLYSYHYGTQGTSLLDSATDIFDALEKQGRLHLDQLVAGLRAAELTDPDGLELTSLVFRLFDEGHSRTISKENFLTLAVISHVARGIRVNVSKFCELVVDTNEDESINLDDLDAALEYLGQRLLTKADRECLIAMTEGRPGFNTIDSLELINYVTVFAIKAMVSEHVGHAV